MKFKFKGLKGYDEMELRGIMFAKGKAVVVKDANLAARLRQLDYFTEVKTKKAPVNDKVSG